MYKIGILVIATEDNGGTFQYSLKMIDSLIQNKNHLYTIYTDINNADYDNLGITVKKNDYSKKSWIIYLINYLTKSDCKNLFKDENLIIAPIYSPALLATKTPFIFTLHDLQEHYYPHHFSWFQRKWRNFINTKLLQKSIKVICESNYVKNDIINIFHCLTTKIEVLPSPPQSIKYSLAETDRINTLNKFNLSQDDYIIYPAQFWKHKNHLKLIEAFKIINDKFPYIKLVLTGKKRFEYNNIIENITRLDLADKVVFTEFVPDSELRILMKNANFLIMPTLFESVSIPIYEAFQIGTPVCASNVVSLPDQVGDAGIIFDPNSVQSITENALLLITNKDLKNTLVNKGYDKIKALSDTWYRESLEKIINEL
jgi:glycosyltransferase involved in cell wall biosynthesis